MALVAEEDAATLRAPAGADLARRVTALVNQTLAEDGVPPLSVDAVLDAIDRGQAQGGASGASAGSGDSGSAPALCAQRPQPPALSASAGRFWVLDPIDGTKGFVRGAQYAVALGLLEDGQASDARACATAGGAPAHPRE